MRDRLIFLSVVIMPSFRRGRRSYRRRRSQYPLIDYDRGVIFLVYVSVFGRRRRTGNINLLAKQVQDIVVTNQADVLLPVVISYTGLSELKPFDALFEAYRFWSVRSRSFRILI